MANQVVTRFAPSPTGYLHIGGARTALFNWLYARGRGGEFHLRIEDTDRARHNDEAVQAILDGLQWLGLDWDGDPVSQFENRDRHASVAQELLAMGKAYRCYLAPEEVEAARNQAREQKFRFESPWRHADPATAPEGAPFSIRFEAPRDGETIVNDLVQGTVRFPNSALDDLILLRSNGAPTYNLAVVVDDHDMNVTHVIRGDDHLVNAARQQQIYEALGWKAPAFAHVPLIHGPDGAKLSKRHGALGVESYKDQGFLPEGLANYLLRLGWSHGNDEIIPREKAQEWFDIDGVNKSPARLDLEKLAFINAHYLRKMGDEDFVAAAAPFLAQEGVNLSAEIIERLKRSVRFLKERSQTLRDVANAGAFLFLKRPLEISGKAAKPLLKDGVVEILGQVEETLEKRADWSSPEQLDDLLQSVAAERGVGFGQIGPPVRAALTGGAPAPSLGEVLYALGEEESLARLRDRIDQ